MAGENEIRGTKNLGLIQAIYSGINPPLNTKVIWYDDNIGIKIHKYYDVTDSTWKPFGGDITINGHYVYIAYASDCDGQDFSLAFDDNIYTHMSIVSSPTEIPLIQLVPDLFALKWIKFCHSADENLISNFTYVAFADKNEEGLITNFSLNPTYEVENPGCVLADGYVKVTPEHLAEPYYLQYALTPNDGGINIDLALSRKRTIEIDVSMFGTLVNLLEYVVEVRIPPTFPAKFFVRLDGSEVGGYSVIPNGGDQVLKFLKVNNGSKLYLEFYEENAYFEDTLFIKVGSAVCNIDEPPLTCIKTRTCWAILTSPTPIETLTAELFEGKWICDCNCDEKLAFDIENTRQLIYNLIQTQQADKIFLQNQIDILDERYTLLSTSVTASPIRYLELRLFEKGEQGGVPNTLPTLQVGDFVRGRKDITTVWDRARYNGGNPLLRTSYTAIIDYDL